MMNCEEFERFGLDMDRADAQPQAAAAAAEHVSACPRCFALLESWRELKRDLRVLNETTRLESAPTRVEMRLKQELRTRREARVPRRTVTLVSWALPVAAALAIAVGWTQLHKPGPAPVNTAQAQAA